MGLTPNSRPHTDRIDDQKAVRIDALETYSHKIAQFDELALRGVDITTLPLLVNSRNISITLNDGTLIFTE